MFVQSTVIKYGDHIDTDVIIPARYLNTTDHAELASHCMEDLDSDFKKKSETSRIIVAGRNFGCGSSREHAPIAIKASGIQLRHRGQLCPDFLPQLHRYRPADHRVPRGGESHS